MSSHELKLDVQRMRKMASHIKQHHLANKEHAYHSPMHAFNLKMTQFGTKSRKELEEQAANLYYLTKKNQLALTNQGQQSISNSAINQKATRMIQNYKNNLASLRATHQKLITNELAAQAAAERDYENQFKF